MVGVTNMVYRLYDTEEGYQGSFPSWQEADNYRFVRGNPSWKIERVSYFLTQWTLKR